MGYTHYWRSNRPLTDEEQKNLTKAMEAIVSMTNIPLAGPMGDGEVEWNEGRVSLNGMDEDAHETFSFPPSRDWCFCKTAYKPYDAVVTAILTASNAICPGAFSYGSDGDTADWKAGLALARKALGSEWKLKVPNIRD